MEANNLTLGPPAAYKTRPGSGAAVPAAGAGQNLKAPVAATSDRPDVDSSVTAAPETTAESPSTRAAEAAVDEKAQSKALVQETLRKLNDLAQTSIAFSQHEETGRTVITVSDKNTGEQIRTIPSEDFLALSAHLEEVLDSAEGLKPGLLVSSRA